MNDIVVTDSSLHDKAIMLNAALDLAFGVDENDFELTVPASSDISVGDYFYFEGTEWGGIVDRRTLRLTGGVATMVCSGRSWHGILSHSIICPDPGSSHLAYSGDLHSIFSEVILRQGLTGLFSVPTSLAGITASGNFDRYTDIYSAFVKLCKSVGYKLVIRATRAYAVELSAVKAELVKLDTDKYELTITEGRYTNHLVCLGSGELENRVVVHRYMDSSGIISSSQSLFGVDEIAEVYDYSNADIVELTEKGDEKLAACFADACELTVADNMQLSIGDLVSAASVDTNMEIEATVEKVIVVTDGKTATVSYEVGNLTRRR